MFFPILLLLSYSCKKDLGSYNYHSIDSVFIQGIEKTYVMKIGGNPGIVPQLSHSSGSSLSSSDYDFEWLAYRQGLNQEPLRISTKEHLNEVISLPIGDYTVYFKAKEKSTNLLWEQKFTIRVGSGFNGGWMILSDDNGKSKIDLFEWNHTLANYSKHHTNFQDSIKDVSKNTMSLLGKPKFITTWSNQTPATGNGVKYFVYVGTDKNTEKTNVTDGFIWSDQYSFKYETVNPTEFETIDAIRPTASRDGYVVKGNDVFVKYAVFQVNVGTPINRLADGTYFKVSPFIAPTAGPSCLMYDITNKRFVRNMSSAVAVSQTPLTYDQNNAAFNPNKVDMDMVWMNQTVAFGGQAYAVLTKSGKYFLARMTNTASAFSANFLTDITSLPGIAQAQHFEVDPRYGYLQYAVGGKIYQYDPSESSVKLMKDYGNKEITVFKYLRSTSVSYSSVINPNNANTYGKRFLPDVVGLVVASLDPVAPQTSGKVEVFDTPQFNADYKTFLSFNGFGRVADVTEAEFPLGW